MKITTFLVVWFVLIWTFAATRMLVVGEDPNNPGFISIDCGALNGNENTELELYYETDDNYTNSGQNKQVADIYMKPIYRPSAKTLRLFPVGTRNCYTIELTRGSGANKYLIRASFLYGSYDGRNQTPTFDLYIGVNFWATINFPEVDSYIHKEIIHVVPSEDHAIIQVCLINTNTGIPFISSLELRPLNATMYQTNATVIALYRRLNIGSTSDSSLFRHPQDVHDRFWCPDDMSYTTTKFGDWDLSSDPDLDRSSDSYAVPTGVLRTFSMAGSAGDLILNWNASSTAAKWIVYFHFAEMAKLSPLRDFTIYTNDKNLTKISLEYLKPVTIASNQFTSNIGFNFKFVPTYADQSPILNALEIYYLLDLSNKPTARDDANAMNDIKKMYNVTKASWQGDPCAPTNFTWEGLNCSAEDLPRLISMNLSSSSLKGDIVNSLAKQNPPRVISMNLSSSSLKGHIANSFANLTKLQYLNLSHNELTGTVPEFLAEMKNLKVLDLSGNKLRGPVPKNLLKKAKANTLLLSLAGNPNLCTSGSCGLSKKMQMAIIIPSASALTAAVAGGTWMIILRKKQSAQRRKGIVNKKGQPESGSQGISGDSGDPTFERSQGTTGEGITSTISRYTDVRSSGIDRTAGSSSFWSKLKGYTEAFWSS